PHDGGKEPDGTTFPAGLTNNPDQDIYTVMSYTRGWNGGGIAQKATQDFGNQEGLGAFDIYALQQLYGANTTWNSGNDTYVLPTPNAKFIGWECIWDTGGDNTISNAGSAEDCTIDLRAASLDPTDPNAGGAPSFVHGVQGGITIAKGVTIQNAIG